MVSLDGIEPRAIERRRRERCFVAYFSVYVRHRQAGNSTKSKKPRIARAICQSGTRRYSFYLSVKVPLNGVSQTNPSSMGRRKPHSLQKNRKKIKRACFSPKTKRKKNTFPKESHCPLDIRHSQRFISQNILKTILSVCGALMLLFFVVEFSLSDRLHSHPCAKQTTPTITTRHIRKGNLQKTFGHDHKGKENPNTNEKRS